ncbi:MAG: galactokinase [Phycisphaerae bacterium]|nr:galactokinase [Phycisphaerae bacterium]
MIESERALSVFAKQFGGGKPDLLVHSPGRVNLIGEHVDYNAGLVLPMAIDRGTTFAVRANGTKNVRLFAETFNAADSFDLSRVAKAGKCDWANYVRGVAALLLESGVDVPGADIAILSDLPVAGGLSSSASLEVGAATAFLGLAGATMEPLKLALLCQRAEHEYAGVPCGLMDQFAVVFGKVGHAIRMDCRTLEHQLVPCDHEAIAWVILDSRAPRKLAASGYAKRRKECDKALALLKKAGEKVETLRDVTVEMLEANEDRLGATLASRVRHVVTEIGRVVEGSEYLAIGQYDLFGRLMYASHRSLTTEYEASIDALDHIVETGADTLGVYGCRMTGGGWGGCAVALLAVEATRFFQERVTRSYVKKFGREPGYVVARPSDGVRVERV